MDTRKKALSGNMHTCVLVVIWLVAVCLPLTFYNRTTIAASKRIGIEAGHWQQDSGAVCPDGVREVDINLAIAQRTVSLLQGQGYTVDLFRSQDPVMSGYTADAFVALHSDYCAQGATGYKAARAADSPIPATEDRLVNAIYTEYGAATGLSTHNGITDNMRYYYAFYQLAGSTPAAILEMGFISTDRPILLDGQNRAAQGIANAIVRFLSDNGGSSTPTPTVTPVSASRTPTATPTQTGVPLTATSTATATPTPTGAAGQAGLYYDDFSAYPPGQLPTGWLLRGSGEITPVVEEVGGTGPTTRLLSFPEVGWQYWDKWVLWNNAIQSSQYTVTVKMRFLNNVADRAGLTIAWNDTNWNRIDIQPNVYGNDIEYRGSGNVTNAGNLPIDANIDYWLRVVARDYGANQGVVIVYWSTNGVTFSPIITVTGVANLAGLVGMSTAGPHLPHTHFDDFRVEWRGADLSSTATPTGTPSHTPTATPTATNAPTLTATPTSTHTLAPPMNTRTPTATPVPAVTAIVPIAPGWNLVALPLKPPSAYTAKTLLAAINGQGGPVEAVEIDTWTGSAWLAYKGLYPEVNDFPIELAQGYFVRGSGVEITNWVVTGATITTSESITLVPGWNLVAVPYSAAVWTANGLLAAINASSAGFTVMEVDAWAGSYWLAHRVQYPTYNNFALEPAYGYFLKGGGTNNIIFSP